jgi:membrane protease YdiL (CAAX protease family)
MFRGDLQGALKDKLHSFYENIGFSNPDATIASRVTSVFFTSVIFGLLHFTNAIMFWCNPILFLPQVVAATTMGLMFSLAKEFSGELHMPIGMHIGNNTIAWAHCLKASL